MELTLNCHRIVVDHRKHEIQGRAKPEAVRPLDPLLVLPCVDSTLHSSYFEGLRGARGVDLLPIALPSTLLFRAQSDHPDVIVIVTEEVISSSVGKIAAAGRNILRRSYGPTSQNTQCCHHEKRFASKDTLGASVGHNYSSACCRDCSDGSWLRCHFLPPPFFPHGNAIRGIRSEPSNPAQLFPAEHLTTREVEVLRLVALGHGNKDVAAQLNVSEHTVKFHVSSVLAKLGARSRTEAVTIGILRGLVAI